MIVTDYLEVELGEDVVRAGQTARVPVRVISTAPAQAVDFEFLAPPEHLSAVALANPAPPLTTNELAQLDAQWWRVRLATAPGSGARPSRTRR